MRKNEKWECLTNILHYFLYQLEERFSNPNMTHNKHKNIYQKLQIIYWDICRFFDNLLSKIIRLNKVDYLYKLYDNIVEINRM